MNGKVYKRCKACSRRIKSKQCEHCGSTNYGWAYRAYVGKDESGRWKEQVRSGFASKSEAEHALTELLTSLQRGTYVPRTSMTLGEFLTKEWLPATAPPRVSRGTWKDRERNLRHHVIEHIGTVPLQDLTAAHINRLYGDLLIRGRRDGEGGLSPTTVRRIHSMLRKALNDAVRWARLERNPVLLADPPPAKAEKAAQRRRMRTWTGPQLRRFLDSTRDASHHPAWFVAATTGLRRSELLGLRWPDIDLEGARLQVRAAVVDGEQEGEYVLQEQNKSDSSARTIHLDQRTVRLLRHLRDEYEHVRRWYATDLQMVFARHEGRWWNPPALSNAFGRAIKSVDMPHIRLHDLRHTHATLLLRAGVNPKVVSERLGHSSVAFTLDTYAHVMPGMQPEAAEKFMKIVYGDDDPNPADADAAQPDDLPHDSPDNDQPDDDTSVDEEGE